MKLSLRDITLAVLLGILLVSCANNPLSSSSDNAAKSISVNELAGTPLPAGSQIDSKNSLIFGQGDGWTGRVEVIVPMKPEDVVKYFIGQYPNQGWALLSSAKSKSSTLIFAGKSKTLTIDISESSGLSSNARVFITAAPLQNVK